MRTAGVRLLAEHRGGGNENCAVCAAQHVFPWVFSNLREFTTRVSAI